MKNEKNLAINGKNFRWVIQAEDAPKSSEFILRTLWDNSWRFERYHKRSGGEWVEVLKDFPPVGFLDYTAFHKMLKECKNLMVDTHKVVYVERPYWWYFPPDNLLMIQQ